MGRAEDESGDFTKGAGLEKKQIERILAYLTASIQSQGTEILINGSECWFWRHSIYRSAVGNLQEMMGLVSASGYNNGRIEADFSVVRGLEYYTGPVYEIELTFEVPARMESLSAFGSVGGGGRYDGLVSRFLDEPVPATGFSIGVSRLLAALFAIKSPIVMGKAALGPVVVTVMDKDRVADYQQMVATLRKAGIRAELYLGDSGFKAQMKYADRRNSPCVIIQGSDEKAKGEVQIKDLAVGAELASIAKDDREGYLAKQAEAQFSVKEAELVEGVRKVLARRG